MLYSFLAPGKLGEKQFYHSGIKRSSFNFGWKIARRFELAKADAKMENGLLHLFMPTVADKKAKVITIK